MFLSEARLAARLHHPNIVQTNEVLEPDGAPVMVMEYLEGQPLSQVIVRGREAGFSLAMQLRVLGRTRCTACTPPTSSPTSTARPSGSFTGTSRPTTCSSRVEGQAKVLDFGIAKLERSLVETEVGTIKGKLRYMAPEQIAGEKLDRRADVYAAGVILWEALVGERMWKGCYEPDIRARVRHGDLQMPQAVRAGVPPALDRICRRALSLSPAERHATALRARGRHRGGPAGGGKPSQPPRDRRHRRPAVRGRARRDAGGDRARVEDARRGRRECPGAAAVARTGRRARGGRAGGVVVAVTSARRARSRRSRLVIAWRVRAAPSGDLRRRAAGGAGRPGAPAGADGPRLPRPAPPGRPDGHAGPGNGARGRPRAANRPAGERRGSSLAQAPAAACRPARGDGRRARPIRRATAITRSSWTRTGSRSFDRSACDR